MFDNEYAKEISKGENKMADGGLDPNLLLAQMGNKSEKDFDNPLMYLIWLYAFRWLNGNGGLDGNGGAAQLELSGIQAVVNSIAQSINDGKFTTQEIQNDLRNIANGLTQGFAGLNTQIVTLINGIESKISECCCNLRQEVQAVGGAVKENAYIIKDAIKDSVIASDKNFCDLTHMLDKQFCNLAQQNSADTRAIIDVIRSEGSATREQARCYHDQAIQNELCTYKTKANNAEIIGQLENFIVKHYTPTT